MEPRMAPQYADGSSEFTVIKSYDHAGVTVTVRRYGIEVNGQFIGASTLDTLAELTRLVTVSEVAGQLAIMGHKAKYGDEWKAF